MGFAPIHSSMLLDLGEPFRRAQPSIARGDLLLRDGKIGLQQILAAERGKVLRQSLQRLVFESWLAAPFG